MNNQSLGEETNQNLHKATFALGCFWGPDQYFSQLHGVEDVTVGYAGGDKNNPTYYNLGSHTETVQITYDPQIISYQNLLGHFWQRHDPTEPRRNQYKSIIFYHNPEQKQLAEQSKQKQQAETGKEVLTEIRPLRKFWVAEDYHQDYLKKRNNEKNK
jgi:methionine-S-sulfoxide reductase